MPAKKKCRTCRKIVKWPYIHSCDRTYYADTPVLDPAPDVLSAIASAFDSSPSSDSGSSGGDFGGGGSSGDW